MYKKNRVYAKHASATQTRQEWQNYLGGPGHEGGLMTTPCNFMSTLEDVRDVSAGNAVIENDSETL